MIREPTGWVANCENCWRELSSDDIDECWPRNEDEFIQDLNNNGWVVDENGEVYCCEACMKEKKEVKMSEERQDQETVSDIMSEMREYADSMEKHLIYDLSECSTDYLRVLADRIEAAYMRFYDKYKEHTDELNRQILVLKHENEMSYAYFCGYAPEEALVAQCSTCRFFQRKHSHCTLNDSLTNAKYKCSGWEFKTNKECADEYKSKLNREVEELRKENTLLRAALKPVLECKVMSAMTAEISPGKSAYCAGIIEEAQRIYKGSGESEVK